MIISKTPYRISFLGGGTDYPIWYEKYGGEVISATINKHLYLTIRDLPNFFDHKFRLVYSKIEQVRNPKSINHKVVREILLKKKISNGLEIHYDGDVPSKSGLGSSSAFVVGIINALNYYTKNKFFSCKKIAQESIIFERKILREIVGSQDQIACSYGGFNTLKFSKNGFKVKNIISNESELKKIQKKFFIVFTGQSRIASKVAKSYEKKLLNEKKSELFHLLDLVKQGKKLLYNKDYDSFSQLVDESWKIKKKLSNLVSNNYIDDLYEKAKKNGATGGKLLGAGGGGFFLFYVPKEKEKFLNFARNKIYFPVEFTNKGTELFII